VRLWLLGALALGTVGLMWMPQDRSKEWTILVAGDFDGYLSPCGCTKPMSGGIKRMSTVVKQVGAVGNSVFLVNGGQPFAVRRPAGRRVGPFHPKALRRQTGQCVSSGFAEPADSRV
jgi:hypothetical protein